MSNKSESRKDSNKLTPAFHTALDTVSVLSKNEQIRLAKYVIGNFGGTVMFPNALIHLNDDKRIEPKNEQRPAAKKEGSKKVVKQPIKSSKSAEEQDLAKTLKIKVDALKAAKKSLKISDANSTDVRLTQFINELNEAKAALQSYRKDHPQPKVVDENVNSLADLSSKKSQKVDNKP